jgi:SsrA-binding protein
VAKDTVKLVAQNKKAHFEYFLEELFEAGLSLSGTEVKSLRQGKCSLKESFVRIEQGEAFLYNMHISPYEQGNIFNKDPLRTRKLLLHKSEIRRLIGKVKTDGYTIVPVKLYFKGNYAKVQIALAKGKKLYDKRQDIAKKDQRREAEKNFKIQKMY